MGTKSERRLCDEVHLNLAYRWFCRLGVEGDLPDHPTFSNRHGRFRGCDLLRRLFRAGRLQHIERAAYTCPAGEELRATGMMVAPQSNSRQSIGSTAQARKARATPATCGRDAA